MPAELSKSLSPCIRNCCLNPDDICLGCGRSLDEIKRWQQLDKDGKEKVCQSAQQRLLQLRSS